MKFELNKALEILERTPETLKSLLKGLSSDWVDKNEGDSSWSPFDVLGHLIEGEKRDWIVRIEIILSPNTNKEFTPFSMTAHLEDSKGKSMDDLVNEFVSLRAENVRKLKSFNISDSDFDKIGIHPEFGEATLKELISTWVTHDLGHIAQISRVMSKQYKSEVGPWIKYLGLLNK